MLWLKALHLIFMVTWFAGLFYLPRLFVYHAMCEDLPGRERFKIMERKLYWGITTPGMVLTLVFGIWMLMGYDWELYGRSGWLHAKLALILFLCLYHVVCGFAAGLSEGCQPTLPRVFSVDERGARIVPDRNHSSCRIETLLTP